MGELISQLQNPTVLPVVSICAALGFLLGLVSLIWVIVASAKSREAAARNADAMTVMKSDWASFANKEKEERGRLVERVERFQNETQTEWRDLSRRAEAFQETTGERVKEMERLAEQTNDQIDRLEEYIRDFFDSELKTVFRSFDRTVGSVLGEMKSELLRGVKRIDEIQAVVDSKTLAQDRVIEGEEGARRFLTETTGRAVEEERAENSPAEEEDLEDFSFREPVALDDGEVEDASEEVTGIGKLPYVDAETPPGEPEDEEESASEDSAIAASMREGEEESASEDSAIAASMREDEEESASEDSAIAASMREDEEESTSEESVIAASMPEDDSDAYETPTQDFGVPEEEATPGQPDEDSGGKEEAEDESGEPEQPEEPEDAEPPFRQAWTEESEGDEAGIALESEVASDDDEGEAGSKTGESDAEPDENEWPRPE